MLRKIISKSKTTVWRFYALTFFMSFSFTASVLVPFFTEWGHISQSQVQFLQSWFMFCIFILEVPTGAVADYLGRKYSVAIGALAVTCGALLYGSIPSFTIFILAEFLFALGVALQSGADSALLYDSLKENGDEEESKTIFGRAHSIKLFAMMLGALIGSKIAATLGLNVPMIISSGSYLCGAIIALSMREPEIHSAPSESRRYIDIAFKGVKFFLSHKKLRAVALDATIVASSAYFVIWLYQPMLQQLRISIANFGIFHAGLVLCEIIIAANFINLEKLSGGPQRFLKLTALVTGLSFILVGILPSLTTLVIFLFCAGGFGLTRLEYMQSYMNKLIPSSERATVLSAVSMFRRLALIFLNPIVGMVAEKSLRGAFFAVGLLPLGMLVFFSLINARESRGA